MCGRTAVTRSSGEIANACTYRSTINNNIYTPKWSDVGSSVYKPSYNKGPTSCAPVLLHKNKISRDIPEAEQGERTLVAMQWGLVPSWHKGNPKDFNFNMINCRSDTLFEKKSFQKALEKGQRCVVLADGFFEWQTSSTKENARGKDKQPFYIQLKDSVRAHLDEDIPGESKLPGASKQMLPMAGLYDVQESEELGKLYTFSIITVAASSSFQWLHHRMPAMLESASAVEKWLDVDNVSPKEVHKLLVPTNCLEWYPVSTFVNNVRNDTEACIKKIDLQKITKKKEASSNLMSSWLSKSVKREGEKNDAATKKAKI